MNRITPLKPATYQDILDAPEGMVAQLINGALDLQPRPASPHQRALSVLTTELCGAFDLGKSGPGGWTILAEPEVHLSESDIFVPDLAGWRKETMPTFEVAPHITPVPDWVCEILSPGTRKFDLTEKRDVYAQHGVGHLWFIDPDARTLEGFALESGKWVLQGAFHDEADIALPPFEAVTFKLEQLWPPAS